MSYAHLSTAELRAAIAMPTIGDVAKDAMRAELAGREQLPEPEQPKSTDPRDRMNQTERRMADVLDMRIRQGELVAWWYEDVKLRLGVHRMHYTPDFVALRADGSLEIVEVKGAHIRDDARAKFEAAARQYPIARWRMMQWANGAWHSLADYAPRSAAAA